MADLLHHSFLTAGYSGALYATTVSAAAGTALFTSNPRRRAAAQEVLRILLRRRPRE